MASNEISVKADGSIDTLSEVAAMIRALEIYIDPDHREAFEISIEKIGDKLAGLLRGE